ncbi:MAG: serine/threonine-protein kinase [Cyanobacteria bacterium P01_E01_bin.42]
MQHHQTGEIVNNAYQILDILGRGGTGITYKALHLQSQEIVALKTLSLKQIKEWKVLELFEREAKTLSRLNHSGIPRYLDFFWVDDPSDRRFYIAQQLVEGVSLEIFVTEGGFNNPTQVWNFAGIVLEILIYLQDYQPPIIHRDIKPQNIIIQPPISGESQAKERVFLVDFGAVQDTYRHTITRGSTVVGTYGYMAPEQFRGQAVLATDLYGLGATLLFILTQKNPSDLPRRNLKIDFRSVITLDPPFADWLEKMLEPALEDRFASAREALAVLRGEEKIRTTPRLIKPPNSPVSLQSSEAILKIEIPPVGFRSDRGLLYGRIVFIWNGILLFLVSSMLLFSLILTPTNYLTFGIFVILALWMLRKFLYTNLSRIRLEIEPPTIRLQKSLWGMRHQNIQCQLIPRDRVRVKLSRFPKFERLFSVCQIKTARKTIFFGFFLTAKEQEWLSAEINEFLERKKTR